MNFSLTALVLLVSLFARPCLAAPLMPVPDPPAIAATAYILQDFHSGRVLAEKNADQPVEPASITKLMTAYVVFRELAAGAISLDDMVSVSEKAWRTPGSRMFIEVGSRVSVEDLLKGMIIQSGNDATVALAEHVAGTEETFALLMNRHARELGLTGSYFVNSSGLPDPNHVSTARDIAVLSEALIREFPEYYKWYSEKEFTYNKIRQHNRNRLLWRDASVDGLKTGHTDSAGYCLVTSAQRDNMRLISVVLGTKSEKARADASQSLLSYGYRFFETHRLHESGKQLASARVWKGASETVPVGLEKDLYITIPRGQYNELQAGMSLDPGVMAPISSGQPLGTVSVTLGEDVVARTPLVALKGTDEGSLWRLLVDSVLLYFE